MARSLRYGERVAPTTYTGFYSAFRAIAAREGVRGFYKVRVLQLQPGLPALAFSS